MEQDHGTYQDERDAILSALQPERPFDDDLIANPVTEDGGESEQAGEQESEESPEDRYKRLEAERDQLRSEAEAERKRREEYETAEQQRTAQAVKQQQEAWERARQEALAHAETLPHRDAIRFMAEFNQQREAALFQWGTQLFQQIETERLNKQAAKIAADHGLPAEEVEALVRAAQISGNPAAMQDEAKRLKARESKSEERVRALQEEINRIKADSARQKLANSPVNRVGSGNRTAPKTYKPGSREQLADLLGIPG